MEYRIFLFSLDNKIVFVKPKTIYEKREHRSAKDNNFIFTFYYSYYAYSYYIHYIKQVMAGNHNKPTQFMHLKNLSGINTA